MKSAGTAALLGGVAGSGLSGRSAAWEDTELVVEQGGECLPIEPLDGSVDIVDLYGYEPDPTADNPRQSNLPAQIEEAQTSRLFFYDGPKGFSLVFVQGGDDDPGGAATFLVCGLSAEGEWVVLDDSYEGATDEFLPRGQEAVLNWAWGSGGRNDGAVFRGFPPEFCVTIKPAFDEEAKLDPFDATEGVTNWQFLSGDFDDPDVVELDMDEPLTIHTGACDQTERCSMSTQTADDPFDAEVTFCCTTALVDAESYDRVYLNLLDGTDERFTGPYEGLNAFFAEDDNDENPNDEIIRSIVVVSGGKQVSFKNPNFERCRVLVDAGGDVEYGTGGN